MLSLVLLAALAPPNFAALPQEFDGTSWGGITLGTSTDASIKKQYANGRSHIRPEGVSLSRTDGQQSTVLLQGRGAKALAIGFTHEGLAAKFSDWAKGTWETLHLRERYTEVEVRLNAEAGMAALTSERDELVLLVMARPASIRTMGSSFASRPSPIRDIRQEFEDSDRRIRLGRTSLSVTVKDLPEVSKRSVERDAQYLMDDYRFPNFVHWRSSHNGTISVSVTLDYNQKRDETEFRASASINGENDWGKASGYGSGSSTRRGPRADRRLIEETVEEALDSAMRSLQTSAEKIKPPSPDKLSLDQFLAAVNQAIK